MSLCACGCGEDAGRLYVSGHNRRNVSWSPERHAAFAAKQAPTAPEQRCACGCGELAGYYTRTRSDGRCSDYVKGAPRRYVQGHAHVAGALEWIECDGPLDTPCWVWARSLDSGGYGTVVASKTKRRAHAFVAEQCFGLPAGRHVHHVCEERACINPEHLKVLTPAAHKAFHTRTMCEDLLRLSSSDGDAIRNAIGSTAEIAMRFGVSRTTVGALRTRGGDADA